jgi:hypothetical protein
LGNSEETSDLCETEQGLGKRPHVRPKRFVVSDSDEPSYKKSNVPGSSKAVILPPSFPTLELSNPDISNDTSQTPTVPQDVPDMNLVQLLSQPLEFSASHVATFSPGGSDSSSSHYTLTSPGASSMGNSNRDVQTDGKYTRGKYL